MKLSGWQPHSQLPTRTGNTSGKIDCGVVFDQAYVVARSTVFSAINDLRSIHAESHKLAEKAAFSFYSEAYSQAWLAVYEASKEALRAGVSVEEAKRISYRVSEWVVLNFFRNSAPKIIEAVYQAALSHLPKPLKNSPLATFETSMDFYQEHFANIDTNAMCILAPWLAQIVPLQLVPAGQRPQFARLFMSDMWPSMKLLMLGQYDADSNFFSQALPQELFKLIFMRFMQLRLPLPTTHWLKPIA